MVFLKWAGGKRALLPQIIPHLPVRFNTYYEPFLGGGALFFYLAGQKKISSAVLSDINPELVNTYLQVQQRPSKLIALLERYKQRLSKTDYYTLRSISPDLLDQVEQAARFIYLNRAGYNGLARYNRAGQFMTGFGRPSEAEFERAIAAIRVASEVLKTATIRCLDFAEALKEAQAGDFCYCDPPYLKKFRGYTPNGFDRAETERLVLELKKLTERQVYFLASNNATPEAFELFSPFPKTLVSATRRIGRTASSRLTEPELLIGNCLSKTLFSG